jgi:hypothetical protein
MTLVLLAGCGSGGGGKAGTAATKPTDPVGTVRAYLAAVFKADGAAACQLLTPGLRQEAAKTVRTLHISTSPTCEGFIERTFRPQKAGTAMLFEGKLITPRDVDGLALKTESRNATSAKVGTGPGGRQTFTLEKVGGRWQLSNVAGIPITL